jgi:hypothetical protein
VETVTIASRLSIVIAVFLVVVVLITIGHQAVRVTESPVKKVPQTALGIVIALFWLLPFSP